MDYNLIVPYFKCSELYFVIIIISNKCLLDTELHLMKLCFVSIYEINNFFKYIAFISLQHRENSVPSRQLHESRIQNHAHPSIAIPSRNNTTHVGMVTVSNGGTLATPGQQQCDNQSQCIVRSPQVLVECMVILITKLY